MFDIGWTEMLVIGVIAIVVVGPKDLPALLRGIGRLVRQLRGFAREFQSGVDEFIRESELDEVKKSIHHVTNFDPDNRPDFRPDPASNPASDPASDLGVDPTGGNPSARSPEKDVAEDAVKSEPRQKTKPARETGPSGEDGKGDGS